MLLEAKGLTLKTPEGRALVEDLHLQLDRDRVALIGRNGVGKSTLLRALATEHRGVRQHRTAAFVPQHLSGPASPGELRRRALERAFDSAAMVLLDEPGQDLDQAGRAWLLDRMRTWDGGLMVVTHDPELLEVFQAFFVMREAGCTVKQGRWQQVQQTLVDEQDAQQRAYLSRLDALEQTERHHHRLQRRRNRKRNVGRLHELDRCQSRSRLNTRKSMAQVSQAKVNARQRARRDAQRAWADAARQSLDRQLPMDLVVPAPPESTGPILDAAGVPWRNGTLDLRVEHERIAVVGPNGCGKSTLLDTLTGHRRVERGSVHFEPARMGVITQAASNWKRDETLLELLGGLEAATPVLLAHRFPIGLASRPLRELSPGERTRAALIALFTREQLELLVLDEPTAGLDLVGRYALEQALLAWTGGLLVASHDQAFLEALAVERQL